jgi:hypothetical protein
LRGIDWSQTITIWDNSWFGGLTGPSF